VGHALRFGNATAVVTDIIDQLVVVFVSRRIDYMTWKSDDIRLTNRSPVFIIILNRANLCPGTAYAGIEFGVKEGPEPVDQRKEQSRCGRETADGVRHKH
jgi:hypothetical protein